MFVLATIEDALHGEVGRIECDDQTHEIRMELNPIGMDIVPLILASGPFEVGLDGVLLLVTRVSESKKERLPLVNYLDDASLGTSSLRLVVHHHQVQRYMDRVAEARFNAVDRGELATIPLADVLEQIKERSVE